MNREYLAGDVYLPIFGPKSTTECRLFIKRGCGTELYEPLLHERKMAGFNQYDRRMQYNFDRQTYDSFDQAAQAVVFYNYDRYFHAFHKLGRAHNSNSNFKSDSKFTSLIVANIQSCLQDMLNEPKFES